MGLTYRLLSFSFLMAVAPYGQIQCALNIIKVCWRLPDSEVIWNITFKPFRINAMDFTSIVMQTKPYNGEDKTWDTLAKCNRTGTTNLFSIQCEIHRLTKYQYKVRVVRLMQPKTTNNSVTPKILIKEENSAHTTTGIKCYPNRGIYNLTSFNITTESVSLTWDYDTYEIDNPKFVEKKTLYVRDGKKVVSEIDNIDIAPTVQKTIGGLEPCVNYTVTIDIKYLSWDNTDNRRQSVNFRTNCLVNSSSPGLHISEIVIILLTVVIVLSSIYLVFYFVKHRRKRDSVAEQDLNSNRIEILDIIEDREFLAM